MDYFSFRQSFESALGKLKLPDAAVLQETTWEVPHPPHVWTVELFIRFPDGTHIRVWESYGKFARLQESRRIAWSYHYGPTTKVDANGNAQQGEPDDPLTLRIDTCSGLHLHLGARDPHHPQDEIRGLDLQALDALSFTKSILKHKKTGKPVEDVLGFTIAPHA